jgi:hypothetical protein
MITFRKTLTLITEYFIIRLSNILGQFRENRIELELASISFKQPSIPLHDLLEN